MTDIAIADEGPDEVLQGHEVLKGVDLDVRRGQIFALLGSNGAGKTTAVNILSTLLTPDSGSCQRLRLRHHRVSRNRCARRSA